MPLESEQAEQVRQALAKLRGLWEAHQGIVELMVVGWPAVPQLKEFVVAPDPSGIFLPRCEAVGVLGALGAKAVLLEVLDHPRDAATPIEQTGDDAVLSACARALERWQDEEVYDCLLTAGRRKPLPGIVEALGNYARIKALPVYDAALAEDFSRSAAEDAFRKLGPSVIPHMISLSQMRSPSKGKESESSKRRRRSVLKLLAEFADVSEYSEVLMKLTGDEDPEIAILACSVCLPRADGEQKERMIGRLMDIAHHCRSPLAEAARNLALSADGGAGS